MQHGMAAVSCWVNAFVGLTKTLPLKFQINMGGSPLDTPPLELWQWPLHPLTLSVWVRRDRLWWSSLLVLVVEAAPASAAAVAAGLPTAAGASWHSTSSTGHPLRICASVQMLTQASVASPGPRSERHVSTLQCMLNAKFLCGPFAWLLPTCTCSWWLYEVGLCWFVVLVEDLHVTIGCKACLHLETGG